MKSTELSDIQLLCEEVHKGNLDTAKLRELWPNIYRTAEGDFYAAGALVGSPLISCDSCGHISFVKLTISAYLGDKWICKEGCAQKYGYCDECQTYVLWEDINNPTHVHEGKENPGFLYFPNDQKVDAWNADIIAAGAHFNRTPDELELARRRRLTCRFPDRIFRYFGVELEVERKPGGPPDLVARTRGVFKNFAMIKRDGSLSRNGHGGFEIVSAPGTMAYHKSGVWTPFFQHLGSFFEENPPTTGLHIHIGTQTLSPLTIDKMIIFVNAPENREFIFALANRNLLKRNPNGRLYAGVKNWKVGDSFKLKQHSGSCPWHPNHRGNGDYYKKVGGVLQVDPWGNPIIGSLNENSLSIRATCKCDAGFYNIEHYEAVNLRTHRPTVELRIFRGVVNEKFLYACLEFVDSLADFCSEASYSALTFTEFLNMVKTRTKRVPNLYQLLVNQCWIDPPKHQGTVNPRDPRQVEQKIIPAYGVYA